MDDCLNNELLGVESRKPLEIHGQAETIAKQLLSVGTFTREGRNRKGFPLANEKVLSMTLIRFLLRNCQILIISININEIYQFTAI